MFHFFEAIIRIIETLKYSSFNISAIFMF